jgi:ABC-type transport system involved in Fe-S cluster assembly fused permease/ATPase subunit
VRNEINENETKRNEINKNRDAVFARVRYHAMHLIALGVFKHLHTLDLSFHLNRRIGKNKNRQ